ncbi:UDP-glycosyltransferase UGT5-like [Hetaerina americana]|uniref:UDP-glycosyltransferase UGT5-like n=1 Tax=Hetaerina americana TaxID=62018 RepID=UPI003A7F6232
MNMAVYQKSLFIVALVVFGSMSKIESGRILAIIPSPYPSHQIWNRALITALLERGHNMTILSPEVEPESNSNKKEIPLKGSYDLVKLKSFHEEMSGKSYFAVMRQQWRKSVEICNHQLHTEGALELLSMPPDAFDLILIETILNDCFYLYIRHFGGGSKIPVVGLTAVGSGPWTDGIMGIRVPPSVSPLYVLPYTSHMSLWQRFHNALLTAFYSFGFSSYYLPAHQKIAEEMYGKPLPPLSDLGSNISIILANNHPAINPLQMKPPSVVEVGGLHCEQSKTLPSNLLQFVNKAEKGIIYVSFGEAIDKLPKAVEQSMIDAFGALGPKTRILWKYDASYLENQLPTNVLAQSWMPQKDILGHPKTLLFVSHGGSLSVQEAIYHGMPMVGIPFLGEQDQNVKRLVSYGAAVELEFESITKESLEDAISTILRNTSFRRKIHKLSSTFRDQPEDPLARAIFWTEYALRQRTGRIEHFHTPSKEYTWLTYYMVDIAFILMFLNVFSVVLIFYGCRYVLTYISSKDRSSKSYKPTKKRK